MSSPQYSHIPGKSDEDLPAPDFFRILRGDEEVAVYSPREDGVQFKPGMAKYKIHVWKHINESGLRPDEGEGAPPAPEAKAAKPKPLPEPVGVQESTEDEDDAPEPPPIPIPQPRVRNWEILPVRPVERTFPGHKCTLIVKTSETTQRRIGLDFLPREDQIPTILADRGIG